MEIANLSVKLSADVENAISGLRKSDAALQKTAGVANKETKKITGFLGKMKMGWVMVGAAAIAGLYAMAKSSAVLSSYLTEYGAVVGAFFDTIFLAFEDEAYKIIDKMWELEAEFEKWPDWAKKATGAIFAIAIAVPTVIFALAGLKWALATLGIPAALTKLASLKLALLGLPAAIFIGVTVGLLGVWALEKAGILADLDELGRKFEETDKIMMDFDKSISGIPGIIGIVAIDIVKGDFGKIPDDVRRIFKEWVDADKRMIERWKGFGILLLIITAVIFNKLKKFTKKTWETIKSTTITIWNAIKDAIWKPIRSAYNKVVEYVNKIIEKMKSIPIVGGVGKYVSRHIPSFQHGGYVPETGLAMLHAGEQVTPAGGTARTSSTTTINYSSTFNITGEMRSDTDLRELADKLSGIMKDDVRRIIR